MLQNEFFEMTKVSLTPEEYSKVECLYNNVQMPKDQFCKEWLKLKDSPLMEELADGMKTLEDGLRLASARVDQLENTIDENAEKHAKDKQKLSESLHSHMEEFGRYILLNIDDESKIYDKIEEEFTLSFIVRAKLEENIELESHEREFLLGKL